MILIINKNIHTNIDTTTIFLNNIILVDQKLKYIKPIIQYIIIKKEHHFLVLFDMTICC